MGDGSVMFKVTKPRRNHWFCRPPPAFPWCVREREFCRTNVFLPVGVSDHRKWKLFFWRPKQPWASLGTHGPPTKMACCVFNKARCDLIGCLEIHSGSLCVFILLIKKRPEWIRHFKASTMVDYKELLARFAKVCGINIARILRVMFGQFVLEHIRIHNYILFCRVICNLFP